MRVFCDQAGKFYKAEQPKHDSDMESNLPTQDMLSVLDETPVTREQMIQKIIDLGNARITSVLAPESNPVEETPIPLITPAPTQLTLVPSPELSVSPAVTEATPNA